MKSRITFFSITCCLLTFLCFTNFTVQGQEHPMSNLIGVWDSDATKSEPAEVLAQMGNSSYIEMTFEWTADKKGIIHTNKGVINGETQYLTLVHFHDFATNTTHILSSFGTGKISYPNEKTVSIEQFGFDGKLLNKQEFVFLNDDEAEGVMEGPDGVKVWSNMKRRK